MKICRITYARDTWEHTPVEQPIFVVRASFCCHLACGLWHPIQSKASHTQWTEQNAGVSKKNFAHLYRVIYLKQLWFIILDHMKTIDARKPGLLRKTAPAG